MLYVRNPVLPICLLALTAPVRAQPAGQEELPQKRYAQGYSQSFTGKTDYSLAWEVLNPGAEQNVRIEANGLHITLPPGWGAERPVTGLRSRFRVKGDFEMTLSFEILKEPKQADAGDKGGTRLDLGIIKDVPKEDVTNVGRTVLPASGKRFIGWASMWDSVAEKKVPHSISRPTQAMTGRLRLVRSGADLYYAFSDGFDGGFTCFKKFPFGAEDLLRVRIVAATGGAKASLHVRVTDFSIRADALPDWPAGELVAEPIPMPVSPVADPPRADGTHWFVAALLAGAVVALLAVVGLGAILFLRRRGVAIHTSQDGAPMSVSFACPKCARILKTPAELAGKKVKCARCGAVVLVPAVESET